MTSPDELTGADLAAYQARFTTSRSSTLAPATYTTLTAPPATATGATLGDDDTAFLRAQLGPDTDLVDAQARYSRLGDLTAVVAEVLRERLSALIAGPAQYAVSGVYSQDTSANIAALREQLGQVTAGPTVLPPLSRISTRPRRSR